MLKPVGTLLLQLQQNLPVPLFSFVLGAPGFVFGHRHPGPGCQLSKGIAKMQIFVEHHEFNRIAPGITGEALEGLPTRRHVHTRLGIVMKRTKRFESRPGPFQWKIPLDELDDIRLLKHFLDFFLGNHAGGRVFKSVESRD